MTKILKGFTIAEVCNSILTAAKYGIEGLEKGSSYASGIAQNKEAIDIVKSEAVVGLAREALQLSNEPIGYLSMTALTVHPGSPGMPGHIDYPHFYPHCVYDRPLSAQFILSLDGTFGGAAPTWIGDPDNIIELNAGDLVAFSGDIKHGVLANTSSRSRTNMLWSVGPAWIRPTQISLWDWRIGDKPYPELIHSYNEIHK